MSTSFEGGKVDLSHGRQAADWGLAAVLLGGILAVMAMLLLQVCLTLFGSSGWGPMDLQRLHDVALYGRIVFISAAVASIAFAIGGIIVAYARRQASALGWAGLVISLIALALWIGVLANLLEVVETLARRQGMKGIF